MENQIQVEKFNEQSLPLYQSLLERIKEHIERSDHSETDQYKKVLSFLYTAILSKIYNLKHNSDASLIININEYFSFAISEIDKLKNLQEKSNTAAVINSYKSSYKVEIDKKINEALLLINNQITPELVDIEKQIDGKIASLISEIVDLRKEAVKNRQDLIKQQNDLAMTLGLRSLFSGLKMVGQVLGFLGPVAQVVGTGIQMASSITEDSVLKNKIDKMHLVKIPKNTGANIALISSNIVTAADKKNIDFAKQLDTISNKINGYKNEELNDIAAKIHNIEVMHKTAVDSNNAESVTQLKLELNTALKQKEEYLKTQKIENDQKKINALKAVGKAKQILEISSVAIDIYNTFQNDDAALDAIQDSIEKMDATIKSLDKHEDNIRETMIPMIQSMTSELRKISNNLDNKSQASLDITKWYVQSALRDMKLNIKQFTQGYKVEEILARYIEKLEEAITTLIKVYDRLQNYQDQQNLANYIADVNSAASVSIIPTDPKLGKAVTDLDIAIRTNIILKQYKTAIDSFKQWIFPFAHSYMKEIELPSHLQLEGSLQNLLSNAVTHISEMNTKIKKYKISIQKQDQYMFCGDFSNSYVSSKPFFVWENYIYKNIISDFLLGKKVVVKADVMKSAYNKDAIKFLLIGITLKLTNVTRQSEINEKLNGFKVSATHMGNSFYRYNETIYVITTESINIQYSFEKNAENEPVSKNKAYSKMKAGDLMLSPYGMWELQLYKTSNIVSFDDLNIFEHEVDLELVGHGCYVTTSNEITDLHLDDYYERYDV